MTDTASCPLSGGTRVLPDNDTACATWAKGLCPLTGLATTPTTTTVGMTVVDRPAEDYELRDDREDVNPDANRLGGQPIVHQRKQCPSPCDTQWWVDSTDGGISNAGRGLIIEWGDDEPAQVVDGGYDEPDTLLGQIPPPAGIVGRNATPAGQRHGGADGSLMDWAKRNL